MTFREVAEFISKMPEDQKDEECFFDDGKNNKWRYVDIDNVVLLIFILFVLYCIL